MSVSDKLWNAWVPIHTKNVISSQLSGCKTAPDVILKFLSAVHDVGKAIPAFQRLPLNGNDELELIFSDNIRSVGLRQDNKIADYRAIKHNIASELILERNGIHTSLSSIIGSHHGNTPNKDEISKLNIESYPANTGFKDEGWKCVQDSFVDYAARISGADIEELRTVKVSGEGQVLLSSLVILSDWIASNELWFPYTDGRYLSEDDLKLRIENGWKSARIPHQWHTSPGDYATLFQNRFGLEPRPFQKKFIEIASEIVEPGLFIVEAPMGEGKTEAALAVSEILSDKFGMGGVLFALPTQATSDGMFMRMKDWIDSVTTTPGDVNSFFLAHGKSRFNSNYTSLRRIGWNCSVAEGDSTVIHEWFTGKKKGLLSDFAIGTVDHVLMGGLKMRHLALRHLALANKVVIIDECHAYDSYMGSYLEKAVEWLGAYRVPTIIMSATLYPSRRKELMEAYLGKEHNIGDNDVWVSSMQYPSITFVDGHDVKQIGCESSSLQKVVNIQRIADDSLESVLYDISKNGGYVGIICNTVARSQHIYETICHLYPGKPAYLIHSRFTCIDRSEKEAEVLSLLSSENRHSPPFLAFVVGTQVMEQSLDLDFDVLVTDMCPMDLLLQRIGRLHRHCNARPLGLEEPKCYVVDEGDEFEKGSEYIYGKYQLFNTRILLPDTITIPSDIPKLVHEAYSGKTLEIDEVYRDDYLKSYSEVQQNLSEKEKMAKIFQICDPWSMKDMIGWLKNSARDDADGHMASATVRDTNGSVEAIMLKDNGDGTLSPVSGDIDLRISDNDRVGDELAFALAGCKISLPVRFASDKMIGHTISQLRMMTDEHIPFSWRSNGWLKDELFIVLEQDYTFCLNNVEMRYSFEEGLVIL